VAHGGGSHFKQIAGLPLDLPTPLFIVYEFLAISWRYLDGMQKSRVGVTVLSKFLRI
jgi:hypothetical protein